jgi:hypothetical protein
VLPKVGTQPPPSLKAADCIAAARGALKKDDLLLTKRALDIAAACAAKEKKAPQAQSQKLIDDLRKLLEAAQDRLLAEAAKDAAAGKHFEALKRYHTYVREYAGLRIASTAATKIAEAQSNPDLRAVDERAQSAAAYAQVEVLLDAQWQTTLAAVKPTQPAPARPADADLVAASPVDKQAAILKLIQNILTDYPDAPAAAKAAALDKAIRANTKLVQTVEKWQADQAARGLFLKASFYEASRATKKAADTYRLLLDKYPKCTYAPTARRKLKMLQ